MGGQFRVSGLASGLDTDALINQLIALQRQPISRIQTQIKALEKQKTALQTIRTDLLSLYNRSQDFVLTDIIFNKSGATSSDESILTTQVTAENAAKGSYAINVTTLASATVATSSGAASKLANSSAVLSSAGFATTPTSGYFTINGVQITVDAGTQTIQNVVDAITASAAGVTASFNSTTEIITLTNTNPADTNVINLGSSSDTSNFLALANVIGATQSGTPTTLTSTRPLGTLDPSDTLSSITFTGGTVSAGTFKINGVTITVGDPATTTVNDVLSAINSADAGVLASFDATTDKIRIVSKTLGSRTVNFEEGTSNFLTATKLNTATQTAGNDAQFTINGGSPITRNTNNINDVISGVTINLKAVGTATVTVNTDFDSIIEDIKGFVNTYNTAVKTMRDKLKQGGDIEGDLSIKLVEDFLRSTIFDTPAGATGSYQSLLDIGISTGSSFSRDAVAQLQVDEGKLRTALEDSIFDVKNLFKNASSDGIAEQFKSYLRDVTSPTGFLQARSGTSGTISSQITSLNRRIESMEVRLDDQEKRLRAQFSRLEVALSSFQQTSQYLTRQLGANASLF